MSRATVYLPNLRRARERFPLKQTELMKRARIKSRTTISRIENGYPADIDTARRLSRALKVSLDYLMGGDEAVPLGGSRSEEKTPLEQLEDRLAQYQERGETNEVRWSRLHGAALFLFEHTENSRQRKRLKEVARRAFDGFLRVRGIDPDEEGWRQDTERALAEVLGEDQEQAKAKEAVGAA